MVTREIKSVLAINTANAGGGAEKVAYTLCKELHRRGFKSKMLAGRADHAADELARELVLPVPGDPLIYSAGNLLDDIFSTQYLFYLPTWKIPLMGVVKRADVIHLHNMHGNYFNLFTLPFLMWQKPIVWTFHDMWPFTGKCAWDFGCGRFIESCGKCPQLDYYPKLTRDTSRFLLRLKKILYGRPNYVIVTPSEWLRSHVQRSILRRVPTHVIPSPIDTKIFYPEDRAAARARLGIPPDKKVVLFIASWINTIPHKGIGTFLEMLQHLYTQRNDMYTIVVGHLQGQSVLGGKFAGLETGWLSDQSVLRDCYAATDVFVSPTLAENSSCTIMEAMACGTATVAYATGGVPEQIVDGETGFLAPSGDRQQLLEAVNSLLSSPEKVTQFGRAASRRASGNFALDIFVKKYLAVYQEAINNKNA